MIAALALAAAALVGLHGYGSFPPWVVPGVVRVPNADGTAYVEVRVQAAGHVGSRPGDATGAERIAPDTFCVVALANPGAVLATPRWMRERERRPLAHGDRLLGSGALARAPLSVALVDEERALAVCDLLGVTVQELDGTVRATSFHADTFGATPSGRFEGNRVWNLDWAQSPPRACAVFDDSPGRLVVAVRFDDGWRTARVDVRSGARVDDPPAGTTPWLDGLAPTPDASVALELHALRVRPGGPPDPTLLRNARRIRGDETFPWEARLVAGAIAVRTSEPTDRGAERSALAAAVRALLREGVGGHASFDDWLALALLPELLSSNGDASLSRDESDALGVALALALVDRELPEAAPALQRLGASAVAPLFSARRRLRSRMTGSRDPARLMAAVDESLEVLLIDPNSRDELLQGLRAELARGTGTELIAALLRAGATSSARDVRALLVRGLADVWPPELRVPGPVTGGVFLAQLERLRSLEERGRDEAARDVESILRGSVWNPPVGRSAQEWWEWHIARGPGDPLPGDLERAVQGRASAVWGELDGQLAWLFDHAAELPEEERWPLLRDSLREARDRIDELGLRAPLAASLGWTGPEGPTRASDELSPEAAAARAEILGWL